MRHVNPYRIKNPQDIFEVGENSSHPELRDAKRLYVFGAYRFSTATELQKFFSSEGLNPKQYWMKPRLDRDAMGNKIIIEVVPKHSRVNRDQVMDMGDWTR